MQAVFSASYLPNLEKLIDYSPPTVVPQTTVWDTILLMNQSQPSLQAVLIVENRRVVGLFSWQDVLQVVESEIDLKKSKITEVMRTSVIKVKYSHLEYTTLILDIFPKLKGIPLVIEDEKEQLLGYIAPENISDLLFKEYKSKITKSESIGNRNQEIISEDLPLKETNKIQELDTLLFIKQAVESHSEALIFTDLTGRIIHLNSSVVKLFQYSREKLNELGGLAFLWNNTEKYEQILASIKQGKYWINEQEIKAENGNILYTNMRTYPINDSRKKVIGMMSVYHTNVSEEIKLQQALHSKINESKELEEELKKALEKEKEINELKNRFISMTSHEFRTPLSTILSSSELLENYRQQWEEKKQLKHFKRIKKAVEHMTNLLNDVLFFGQAKAGKLDCNPGKLDLVEYSRQIIEDLDINQIKNAFEQQPGVAINFLTNNTRLVGLMDERTVGHILNNLLSNAIKYSNAGTTVKFTLYSHNKRAIFEIEDEGIGIPSEELSSLFDSFYRCKNVSNIPGTGLGLSIVKKCVDMLQGEINIKSEIGVGTKFTVAIPLNNCY